MLAEHDEVKLPSHLWRTGLGNVPRDEGPQSVLNGTHRPAPLGSWANGRRRGAQRERQAQLHSGLFFFLLINTADVNLTQYGSNEEQFNSN